MKSGADAYCTACTKVCTAESMKKVLRVLLAMGTAPLPLCRVGRA